MKHVRIILNGKGVAPRCLPLVLPEDCPLIARGAKAQ